MVPTWLRISIGAAATMFVCMGLGRFSYGPMIPALVEAGELQAAEAGYVGAGNLFGFLLGALIALYERAVGIYASLHDINAYDQPGVEAGKLAASEVLRLQSQVVGALANGVSGTAAQVPDDPELARLYEERNEIQRQIDEVRALRESMTEDQFLDAMEPFLIELALKNREIRALEGGGP